MLKLGTTPHPVKNLSGVGARPRKGAYDHPSVIVWRRLVASPPAFRSRVVQCMSAAAAHPWSTSAIDAGLDGGRAVEQVLAHPVG